MPFDAGEVDSPGVVGLGGQGHVGRLSEGRPGDGDFEGPAFVGIGVIVDGSLHLDGGAEAGDLPAVVGRAAVFIGLGEEEVPGGVEGVHFEFEVFVGVGVGIDEEFEVVVVEDDGVVLGEGAPDVGFFEFGGDVEVLFVPLHFGAGLEAGFGFLRAFDVEEEGGPGGLLPLGVEVTVDLDWLEGAGGDVAVGLGGEGEEGKG